MSELHVLHLGAGENWIEAGLRTYMVTRDRSGTCHTLAGKCPHRGGPLHLGSLDESLEFIVCPWHHNKTRVTALAGRSLPTVRRGSDVTVVVGVEAGETPHAIRRTFLLDCSGALRGSPR